MKRNLLLRIACCALALMLTASCEPQPAGDESPSVTLVAPPRVNVDARIGAKTKLQAKHTFPDNFGKAVAIDGDTIVVGAPSLYYQQGEQSGAAYVFQRNQAWTNPFRLTAGDTGADYQYDEHFGAAVGIAGDLIAVGALAADDAAIGNDVGAVYLFERSGDEWIEQAKLLAEDAAAGDEFGNALSMNRDTLAITNGHGAQAVYIFQRSQDAWTQQAKLVLGEDPNTRYLVSLALSGETLAVGMITYSETEFVSNKVIVFQRDGTAWSQQAELVAGDGASYVGFGISVALDGDTLAVGASGDSDAGLAAGAAYLFQREGDAWIVQDKLTAADADAMEMFGSSVALRGDLLVVGAMGDDDAGYWVGSAYVFRRDGGDWIDQLKLIGEENKGDSFGSLAAVSGNTILIGAPGEFGYAAFVFDIAAP